MRPTIANKKKLLTELYKKTLSTPRKLLAEAKKSMTALTMGDVQSFLREQSNYIRTTKMSYRKYPRSQVLRHIYVAEPYRELFVDTWYLKQTISTHFCFAIICGFTKFLWVRFSKVLNAASL